MKTTIIAAVSVAAMSIASIASAQSFSSPEITVTVGGTGGLTASGQAGVEFGDFDGYAYGETMLGSLNTPLNFQVGLGMGYDLGTKTFFDREAAVNLDVYGGIQHTSILDMSATYGVAGAEAEAHPGIFGGEFAYGNAEAFIGTGPVSVQLRFGAGYEHDFNDNNSVRGTIGCVGSVVSTVGIGLGCGELTVGATYKF